MADKLFVSSYGKGIRSCSMLGARLFLGILLSVSAPAKDSTLTAIVLFDRPGGPSYVQITALTLNGKTEVRVCDGVSQLSKKTYGKLPRAQLRGAKSLQRDLAGNLTLSLADSSSICVVPGSLNFEQKREMTLAEAVQQSGLQGSIVSSYNKSMEIVPAFSPGVQVIFIANPDADMAEFLRAQRAATVAAWKEYLGQFPASGHAGAARQGLAGLYHAAAAASISDYLNPSGGRLRDLKLLARALHEANNALATVENYAPAREDIDEVHAQLGLLVTSDRSALDSYRKAVRDHRAGYVRLTDAIQHNTELLEIDASFAPALDLKADLEKESKALLVALAKAQAAVGGKSYDEAFAAVSEYRAFAAELPAIAAIVESAYSSHLGQAKNAEDAGNWELAVAEYGLAIAVKTNDEATAALKNAREQLLSQRNRAAADKALLESKAYIEQKDAIQAYIVLAELQEPQRALVQEQMAALQPDFVTTAFTRAQQLQELHTPIHGRADEDYVRQAYQLLRRAFALSDDQSIKLKLDLLCEKISGYYLVAAKRYLEKPAASGIGVGWYYLEAARQFKPDLEAVRDEKNRYAPVFNWRSYLSVAIEFRDQTSRRESAGYADQLVDAIAAGLEGSGIRVDRHPSENTGTPANFVLVGEVLQDRVAKEVKAETLQSKYRAGTHDVKNDAWVDADHELQAAEQNVKTAEAQLQTAVGRNKKKEIDAGKAEVTAAKKAVEEARNRRDALDKAVLKEIILPYNYTRTIYEIKPIVEVAFRITDRVGNVVERSVPLSREDSLTFTVLENVKPEDTEGIKTLDKLPEEQQIREALEIVARDNLVKAVQQKVLGLPVKILESARNQASQNNYEAAAELYILYLNATADDSPARAEAVKFLQDQFNLARNDPFESRSK
jgi:hypothetical protein